ncbi:hypothetical protein RhiirA4_470434 [Rhizophagus irregularis]|uniref:Uncharacterized protein n=1 Tax=Rhizophagus irregularis TaxID=588596 RepID=A0A2I1H1B6_9GLOM|nr:hypothetical protein RhiirA4_470434 [Rhizophagus irregularis]
MKWSHFLAMNNLSRKFNGKDIVLRKDLPTSTRKESNKEIIMWKKGKDYIYSVKSKKSRSKNYDEVGKHLILHEDLKTENTKYNSPFLMDCKGEEKLKNNEIENVMKPYMMTENIEIQNETAIEANIGEDNELKETLRNFVDEWLYIVDKEVIVNIRAVIQKGDELCLDGFLGIELIPKSSDIYKFNFDGILRFVKDERNVYIIALIIAIIILPCNIKTEIRTDLEIIDCLYKYSKIGSFRRELDDKLYICLNFINTVLVLKNIHMLVKDDKMGAQKAIQGVKVPAIKKELISCKQTIKEIEIKMNN